MTALANLIVEGKVLLLELLIFVSLLRVQIIKACLVCVVDILDLLFKAVHLILHVSFFGEKIVEVGALLVVLVFDVHV